MHFSQLCVTTELQKEKPIDLREVILMRKFGETRKVIQKCDWTDRPYAVVNHLRKPIGIRYVLHPS